MLRSAIPNGIPDDLAPKLLGVLRTDRLPIIDGEFAPILSGGAHECVAHDFSPLLSGGMKPMSANGRSKRDVAQFDDGNYVFDWVVDAVLEALALFFGAIAVPSPAVTLWSQGRHFRKRDEWLNSPLLLCPALVGSSVRSTPDHFILIVKRSQSWGYYNSLCNYGEAATRQLSATISSNSDCSRAEFLTQAPGSNDCALMVMRAALLECDLLNGMTSPRVWSSLFTRAWLRTAFATITCEAHVMQQRDNLRRAIAHHIGHVSASLLPQVAAPPVDMLAQLVDSGPASEEERDRATVANPDARPENRALALSRLTVLSETQADDDDPPSSLPPPWLLAQAPVDRRHLKRGDVVAVMWHYRDETPEDMHAWKGIVTFSGIRTSIEYSAYWHGDDWAPFIDSADDREYVQHFSFPADDQSNVVTLHATRLIVLLPSSSPPPPVSVAVPSIPPPEPFVSPSLPPSIGAPMLLQHAEIARRLHAMRLRTRLRVHWLVNDVAATWFGCLVQLPSKSHPAVVAYDRVQCDRCGELHPLDIVSQPVWPLPEKEMTYFAVDVAFSEAPATPPCCFGDSESDDDDEVVLANTTRPVILKRNAADELGQAESALNPQLAKASGLGEVTPRAFRRFFIFASRPPHVHVIAWKKLAESTRTLQRTWLQRVRGIDSDLLDAPIGPAIVEMVMRYKNARGWRWSTVATTFSVIASAVANLRFYTAETRTLDLRKDPLFMAASQKAQHLARTTHVKAHLGDALDVDDFEKIKRSIKSPSAQLLCELSWVLAARVGDLRQVTASDTKIEGTSQHPRLVVTYRRGKGAAFWGPYSCAAVLPPSTASRVRVLLSSLGPGDFLFSLGDQACVASAVKELEKNLSVRSIRKGSLTMLAKRGVSDGSLMLLSGHKRRDTLARYLGWGAFSASMWQAADEAAAVRDHPLVGGAAPLLKPAKMGPHSGFCGHLGQRVATPPKVFPLQPPSADDLGIGQEYDTSDYTLHVKRVPTVSWPASLAMAAHKADLLAHIKLAQRWTCDASLYDDIDTPDHFRRCFRDPHRIPIAKLNPAQVAALIDFGKLEPVEPHDIKGWSSGFLVAQHNKRRWRPVFEPAVNKSCRSELIRGLSYPSRLQRRLNLRGMQFVIEFDFSAWYDQIELDPEVRNFFVIRTKDADNIDRYYRLTKLPMGASFAASVAQSLTSLFVDEVMSAAVSGLSVVADTMIDNVRIAAASPKDFCWAVRSFLQRARNANALCSHIPGINGHDVDPYLLSDDEIIALGRHNASEHTFLGEVHEIRDGAVFSRSAPRHVDKLTVAFHRIKGILAGSIAGPATRRQVMALVGLILWMGHTVQIPPYKMLRTIRLSSVLAKQACADHGWDEPVRFIAPSVMSELDDLVRLLEANTPSAARELLPPSSASEDYDTLIMVDAMRDGWGAIIWHRDSEPVQFAAGWSAALHASAHAEPYAAVCAIHQARLRFGDLGNLALITDHIALANGQRRWDSNYGGFSSAYPLNSFFKTLYSSSDRCDVFYVDGASNLADGPSRGNQLGQQFRAIPVQILKPSLASFHHPFTARKTPQYG